MVTQRKLKSRLNQRKDDLKRLEEAYCEFRIGDSEYNKQRPILLGRIEELEELCHIKTK